MKHIFYIFYVVCFLLLGAWNSAARAEVVLHAFDWPYTRVAQQATEIASLGYKAVLVVPPLKSGPDCAWYIRYQPQDLRTIDHCRGNSESFKSMVTALKAVQVKVYADLVLNHMANERNGALDFPGAAAVSDYQARAGYWSLQRLFGDLRYGIFGASDFNEARCISNYNDVWQVQNWRLCGGAGDLGLPDLRDSTWVIQQQREYLRALNALGVDGYRIDAAKHMKPAQLNGVFTTDIVGSRYVFAEIITGGGAGTSEYDSFLAPFLRDYPRFAAYDFPLLNTLKRSFGLGGSMSNLVDPGAYGQALNPFRALTVVTTHDIPNNSGFRYLIFDPTDEKLAYAYVLGRDGGTPMLYSDYTQGDNSRWFDAHKNADLVKMVRFHNRMQGLGQEMLAWNDCAILFRRAQDGIVGINKCGSEVVFNVNTNQRFFWNRNYREQLTQSVLRISTSTQTFRLAPRAAAIWVIE